MIDIITKFGLFVGLLSTGLVVSILMFHIFQLIIETKKRNYKNEVKEEMLETTTAISHWCGEMYLVQMVAEYIKDNVYGLSVLKIDDFRQLLRLEYAKVNKNSNNKVASIKAKTKVKAKTKAKTSKS